MRTNKWCSLRWLIQTKWTLAVINILRPYQLVNNATRFVWRFTDALRFGVIVRRLMLSTYSTVEICWQHWHSTRESACIGCQSLHPPSPFIIITRPESWYSFYRPTEGWRLSRPGWLVAYRDGVPAHRRSPILVLTVSDVAQLRWSIPTRYHYAKPPTNRQSMYIWPANSRD